MPSHPDYAIIDDFQLSLRAKGVTPREVELIGDYLDGTCDSIPTRFKNDPLIMAKLETFAKDNPDNEPGKRAAWLFYD